MPEAPIRSGPVPGPRWALIKRLRLPVDTLMVDDQDEVDEFEFEFEEEFEDEDYESLKDRVRRGPILGVLLGTTLFAGAIWVVLNAIVDIHVIDQLRPSLVDPGVVPACRSCTSARIGWSDSASTAR
jgi:hypothetical protein